MKITDIGLLSKLSAPVNRLRDALHLQVPHVPKGVWKFAICATIIFVGTVIAKLPLPHLQPEFLHHYAEVALEGFGFTIHAVGATPIVEGVLVWVANVAARFI